MEVEKRSRDITREFKYLMQQNKLFPMKIGSAQSERFGPEFEGTITSKVAKSFVSTLEKA